jgi:hypothetical protein
MMPNNNGWILAEDRKQMDMFLSEKISFSAVHLLMMFLLLQHQFIADCSCPQYTKDDKERMKSLLYLETEMKSRGSYVGKNIPAH